MYEASMAILTVFPGSKGFTATIGTAVLVDHHLRAAAEAAARDAAVDRVVFGTTPVHGVKSTPAAELAAWARERGLEFGSYSCLRALAFAARAHVPVPASSPGRDVAGAVLPPASAQNAFAALAGAVSGPRRIVSLIASGKDVWIASFNASTIEPLEAENVVPSSQLAMLDRLVQPALYAGDVQLVPRESRAEKHAVTLTGDLLARAFVSR